MALGSIGFSFAPSQDTQVRGNGGNGDPQEAIRLLRLRVPKSPLGPSAIAPRALLESPGAAGVPSLSQILAALAQAFAPAHQPGVPSLSPSPSLSTSGRPLQPFSQTASYQLSAPSTPSPSSGSRTSVPAPRVTPADVGRRTPLEGVPSVQVPLPPSAPVIDRSQPRDGFGNRPPRTDDDVLPRGGWGFGDSVGTVSSPSPSGPGLFDDGFDVAAFLKPWLLNAPFERGF